jgi:hypothetical protein
MCAARFGLREKEAARRPRAGEGDGGRGAAEPQRARHLRAQMKSAQKKAPKTGTVRAQFEALTFYILIFAEGSSSQMFLSRGMCESMRNQAPRWPPLSTLMFLISRLFTKRRRGIKKVLIFSRRFEPT